VDGLFGRKGKKKVIQAGLRGRGGERKNRRKRLVNCSKRKDEIASTAGEGGEKDFLELEKREKIRAAKAAEGRKGKKRVIPFLRGKKKKGVPFGGGPLSSNRI